VIIDHNLFLYGERGMKKKWMILLVCTLLVSNSFAMKKDNLCQQKLEKIFNKKTKGMLKKLFDDDEKGMFEKLNLDKKLEKMSDKLKDKVSDVADAIGYTLDKTKNFVALAVDDIEAPKVKTFIGKVKQVYLSNLVGKAKNLQLYKKLKKLPEEVKLKVVEKWVIKNQGLFQTLLPQKLDKTDAFSVVLLLDNFKFACNTLLGDVDMNKLDDIEERFLQIKEKVRLSTELRGRLRLVANIVKDAKNGVPVTLTNKINQVLQKVKEKTDLEQRIQEKMIDAFCNIFCIPMVKACCIR